MGGLPGGPETGRPGQGNHDTLAPPVAINGRRRIVSVPGIDPVEAGLARQQALADQLTSQLSPPALMVWRSQPALLVGRSERRLPYFQDAAAASRASGWPVLLRKSGGEACPVGRGTVQVSMIDPVLPETTMSAKYMALAELLQATLCLYRIVAQTGLVAGAYCPGTYDLAVAGKKIAGLSQHWFRNHCAVYCVVTAASINIEEAPDEFARVVNQFYSRAGSPFRCQAVALTNMRLCGGTTAVRPLDFAAAVINQLLSCANKPAGGGQAHNPASQL